MRIAGVALRFGLPALLPWLLAASTALADGWHNNLILTTPPENWIGAMRRSIDGMQQAVSALEKAKRELEQAENPGQESGPLNAELETGVDLESLGRDPQDQPSAARPPSMAEIEAARRRVAAAERAVKQQEALLSREAAVCLEVLRSMDQRNIFAHEFPNFPQQRIPFCRQAARQLLAGMGPVGGRVVAGQMRSELMRGTSGMPLTSGDLVLPVDYFRDLYNLLDLHGKSGNVSTEDAQALVQAAQGAKAFGPNVLADRVEDLAKKIQALQQEGGLAALLDAAAETDDRELKSMLMNNAARKLPDADVAELLETAEKTTDVRFRRLVVNELRKRLPKLGIVELLRLLGTTDASDFRAELVAELDKRRPTFSDVKDQLEGIVAMAGSDDQEVAKAARGQLANAFQRAPIPHSLYWLGEADEPVARLIWEQIDGRIARADSARRAAYRESGLAVLAHRDFGTAGRKAALELLARLKDPAAVGPVAELLSELPRELWPAAGQALGAISGEDFGPHENAGIADVAKARKSWQAWAKQKGSQ